MDQVGITDIIRLRTMEIMEGKRKQFVTNFRTDMVTIII